MKDISVDTGGKALMNEYAGPFYLQGEIKDECVLLIHGFTGSPADMLPLGKFLNDNGKGYTVYGILLPGHGTEIEDMLDSDWKKWVLYSAEKFEKLKKIYDKVSIIGFSMGGNIALCIASGHKVNKVVCIGTPIFIKNKLYFIAEFLSLFKKYTYWKKSKPLPGEIIYEYETGYKGMPVKSLGELRNITIATFNRLKRIRQPLLVAHGLKDKTVHGKSPYIIFDKSKSEYKELLLLEMSGHNVIRSPERSKFFEACRKFLLKSI